jgi:hypothetical protein
MNTESCKDSRLKYAIRIPPMSFILMVCTRDMYINIPNSYVQNHISVVMVSVLVLSVVDLGSNPVWVILHNW